jgi:hypothetical protein
MQWLPMDHSVPEQIFGNFGFCSVMDGCPVSNQHVASSLKPSDSNQMFKKGNV